MRSTKIIAVFRDGTQVVIENPKQQDRSYIFKQWCKRNNVEPFAVLY